MGIGKYTDLSIYQDYFHTGMIEAIAQALTGFNEATLNTLTLTQQSRLGHYAYTSMFNRLATITNRRDIGSVSAQTPTTLTNVDHITVKLNRKIKDIQMTEDAWKKQGKNPEEMVTALGVMAGKDRMQEYLNTSISALVGALSNQSSTNYVSVCATGAGTMTATNLNTGFRLYGDAASGIRFLVMHSKPYYDLVAQAISDKVYGEVGNVIYGAAPGTFGRPVLVTDSSDLVTTDGTNDAYYTLGLTEGAANLEESEDDSVLIERVGGLENITIRFQGEYAYNIGLKGFQWDVANGGINPSSVATGSLWDMIATSYKNLGGVVIKSL